jgi:hypothetical protein
MLYELRSLGQQISQFNVLSEQVNKNRNLTSYAKVEPTLFQWVLLLRQKQALGTSLLL